MRVPAPGLEPGAIEKHILAPESRVGCILHHSSVLTATVPGTGLRASRSSMIAFEDTAVLCERTAVSVFHELRTEPVGIQAAIDPLDWVGLCEERCDL